MFAIAFDLATDELKEEFGESYNDAYSEIQHELENLGFEWAQESMYINADDTDGLTAIYKAINRLSHIDWFKKSVRVIRAFKVNDWSDFTEIVKA